MSVEGLNKWQQQDLLDNFASEVNFCREPVLARTCFCGSWKKRKNKTDNNLGPHGITELIQMWPKNVDQVDRMVLEHFPQGSVVLNCDLIHLQHCDWHVLARADCARRVAYHVAWRVSPTLS